MARKILYLSALILALIAAVGGCSGQDEGDRAEAALRAFFSSLHEGQFEAAAELYGGSYEQLSAWNPDVNPGDHAALLARGCTVNRLQCLPIKTVGSREHSAPDTYEITVQFANDDGSIFTLVSADAAAAGNPDQATFTYSAVRSGDGFVVRELPPYVD